MKRVLCVLAALCLLLTMMPAPVRAGTMTRMSASQVMTMQPKKVGKGTIEPQVNPLYADVLEAPELTPAPHTISPQTEDDEKYGDEAQLIVDIRENLKGRNEEFTVFFKTQKASLVTGSGITAAFYAAFDHTGVPTEGDYLEYQYGWWAAEFYYFYDNGYYYVEVPFYLMYYTTSAQEAEMDLAVEELLDALDLDGKSDYEKICGVYDYITANVCYDYEHPSDYYLQYTAYAALVNKTAVCQGYANLLYRLLLELDVDNRIVVGDAGGPHAWNIVQLDGWYYYADSTWDAYNGYYGWPYDYFLRGSDIFTMDHTPDSSKCPCVLEYPINTIDYDPSNEPPADPDDPEIPTEPEKPTYPDADYLEEEWELLKLTNRERDKAGLAPLTTTKALFQATDIRALELMEKYAHERPDGSTFDSVLYDLGIEFRMAGENKDAGCTTPEELINAWMGLSDSRGHILGSSYAHMGAGYKQTDDHTYSAYWNQLFYTDEYCHYTGLSLNTDALTVEQGTGLEDMKLWGVLTCYECGECYLPILAEYCSGFDPDALGVQTVTVSALNHSDTVEITVTEPAIPALDLPECLDSEWEVLRLTNRERHQYGLEPVTTQDILCKAAGIRAEEITKRFEHFRPEPDNSEFSTVFFDVGYPWYSAGENIAAGQRTPAEVVTAWMDSPGHRANILEEEFTHLGVGYVAYDDVYAHYWTQLFTTGWECQNTALELGVDYVEVEVGTELEDLPLWAKVTCTYCGECYLPILPEYCSGYESGTPGACTVTVSVYGLTDTLEVMVLGDEPDIEYGDANGDDKISTLDAILLRQYLASWEVSVDPAGADCNCDGKINTLDAILLRQYLAGWDVTLGPQT